MAEYTRAIDSQISQLLRTHGHVSPNMLAGLAEPQAAELLAEYVRVHQAEVALVFDGERLTWASAPSPPPVSPAPAYPTAGPPPSGSPYTPEWAAASTQPASDQVSPVDQLLSAPSAGGKALLDVEPSGNPYPRWAWWPPLLFGLIGGIFSWLIVRDANPRTAFKMLMTGLAVQAVSACIGVVMLSSMSPAGVSGLGASGAAAQWPPSPTQKVTFYYFGTSN